MCSGQSVETGGTVNTGGMEPPMEGMEGSDVIVVGSGLVTGHVSESGVVT
jgi:hypothetical protein